MRMSADFLGELIAHDAVTAIAVINAVCTPISEHEQEGTEMRVELYEFSDSAFSHGVVIWAGDEIEHFYSMREARYKFDELLVEYADPEEEDDDEDDEDEEDDLDELLDDEDEE